MNTATGLPGTERRTKIVCTLGPASRTPDMIEALIKAGMNVARVNMSHGAHAEHAAMIDAVRAVARKLGVHIPIMLDLSGPKMRIGRFASGAALLRAGDTFTLTSRDVTGADDIVSVTYAPLISDIGAGDRILMGDGEIELEVESVTGTDARCRVVSGGRLGSGKGINAPGVSFKERMPTPKDLDDVAFGVKKKVDWLAMSFVRTVDDVVRLRDALAGHGAEIPVVVKIEKREALDSIEGILKAADGVMIARGDLGLETPLEQVPFVQKDVIAQALKRVIPSIVATQMLESMIANPRPTRAEAADVFNAVIDGADAIMLSGETAVGQYPVEAVATMARIALASESRIDYEGRFRRSRRRYDRSVAEAVAHAACDMAIDTDATVIICATRSGQTAAFVSNNRAPAKIAVVSPHDDALNRAMLMWHTHPIKIPLSHDTDTMIRDAQAAVLQSGIARAGDRVVIVAGVPVDVPGNTNMILTATLGE